MVVNLLNGAISTHEIYIVVETHGDDGGVPDGLKNLMI